VPSAPPILSTNHLSKALAELQRAPRLSHPGYRASIGRRALLQWWSFRRVPEMKDVLPSLFKDQRAVVIILHIFVAGDDDARQSTGGASADRRTLKDAGGRRYRLHPQRQSVEVKEHASLSSAFRLPVRLHSS